jgi:hypothetical protein
MEKGRESGTSSAAYPTEYIRSNIRKKIVKQEPFMPPLSYVDGKEKAPRQLT